MITAVLVDDERPSLKELEYLLRDYPDITVTGMFTDPVDALENIAKTKPSVVFLDIDMPRLRGIDAASEILSRSPRTDIVFVTAYDLFAIDAFDLQALDYILKPIDKSRFKKTVERIAKNNPEEPAEGSRAFKIKCFGKFQAGWSDEDPIKWRSEKTRELFVYLLFNRQRSLSKDELLDVLWAEDAPEKAIRQLYNGIYYIRKALEANGVDRRVMSVNNDYKVVLGQVDFDVERFMGLSKELKNLSIEELQEIDRLYSDDYLSGEDYMWPVFERERLSSLYLQNLVILSQKYIENGEFEHSEDVLLKAFNKYPFEEILTEKLLEIYCLKNYKYKAIKHFEVFSGIMKKELNINPNEKIRKLYLSIL